MFGPTGSAVRISGIAGTGPLLALRAETPRELVAQLTDVLGGYRRGDLAVRCRAGSGLSVRVLRLSGGSDVHQHRYDRNLVVRGGSIPDE